MQKPKESFNLIVLSQNDYDKVKASSLYRQCPYCKTINFHTFSECQKCGASLPKSSVKHVELKSKNPKTETIVQKASRKKIKLPASVVNVMMIVFGFLMVLIGQMFTGWIMLGFVLGGVFLIIISVKGGIFTKKKKK